MKLRVMPAFSHPLLGCRRYKFHSRRPALREKPDLRLIYRIKTDTVVVLAVGQRKPHQPDDIYRIAGDRLPMLHEG